MKRVYFLLIAISAFSFGFVGCDKSIHFKTIAELDTTFYLNQVQEPQFSLYQDYGYAKEKIIFEAQGAEYQFESLDESIQKSAVSNALKFTQEGTFTLEGFIKVLNLPYKVPFKKEVIITKESLEGYPIVGPTEIFSDEVESGTVFTYHLPVSFGEVDWQSNRPTIAEITPKGGVATFKGEGRVQFTAILSHEIYACNRTIFVEVKKSLPRFESLKITKAENVSLSVEEYVATFDGANYEFFLNEADYALSNLVPTKVAGADFVSITTPLVPATGGTCTFRKNIFGSSEEFIYPIVFKKAK